MAGNCQFYINLKKKTSEKEKDLTVLLQMCYIEDNFGLNLRNENPG